MPAAPANQERIVEEVRKLIWVCEESSRGLDREPNLRQELKKLDANLTVVGDAWSGSWLGYQAHVYYDGLRRPSPGDHFSQEWGLQNGSFGWDTRDRGWTEVAYEYVKQRAFQNVAIDFDERLESAGRRAKDVYEQSRDQLTVLFETLADADAGQALVKLRKELDELLGYLDASKILLHMQPSGKFMSRDTLALTQGFWAPHHLRIQAWKAEQLSAFEGCSKLARVSTKLLTYLGLRTMIAPTKNPDIRVFIGHGRSPLWRELKDFVSDRLRLPWDEFNRESVAGVHTTERLSQMLDQATFALLVLTAEDEHKDGRTHARENVVHEVGLFQGRLGFRRAIILLEEGCAEFSNIVGLTHVPFPKGRIAAAFEEVRRVLEREGLLTTS